jgi:hypothetical protein
MLQTWKVIGTLVVIALTSAGCGSDGGGSRADTPLGSGGAWAAGSPGQPPGSGTPSAGSGTGAARGGAAGRASAGTSATAGGPGPVSTAGRTGAGAGALATAGGGAPAAAGGGASGSGPNTNTNPNSGAGTGAPAPACMSKAPKEFELNTSIGGGGQNQASEHFALYGSSDSETILNFMEAAHQCFIMDWCFRTPGLSVKSDDGGPYYKTNIYSTGALNAGGLTYWDEAAQLSYIRVLSSQASDPKTTVHEYGHAITMSEFNWIEQKRTGYWWETVANWVSYSFLTSPHCQSARTAFNIAEGTTILDGMRTLETVYNQSHTVLCNDQNYYQAWPFLTYLTNNPDNYPGLGKLAVQDLMRKYDIGSNETPLHTLDRIAAPIKAQAIIGRYWARMAYMDIGFPVGQKDFLSSRDSLNFGANWDSSGSDMYTVKSNRRPQYAGANITPLKVSGSGEVSIAVENLGNGQPDSNFTATLSIRASDGSVRYVDLPGGTGQGTINSGEEASLVVVNTPDTLIQFDPQYIGSPENIGLNYSVQLSGATPAE